MSPKRELAPIQVQATASLPSEQAKDSNESLRARKLNMKPQDRAKGHVKRNPKAFRAERDAPRRPFKVDQEDPPFDVYAPVKEVADPVDDAIYPARNLERAEVPILTIIRSSHPWDGIGADFELVSDPGDVIALDDDDEDTTTDDEWDAVDDFETKVTKPTRPSYATAVKAGRKAD